MNYYPTLGAVLWGYVTLWFLISLIKVRNDVADVAWGLGFVLKRGHLSFYPAGLEPRDSVRHLGQHLGVFVWHGISMPAIEASREDFRGHGLETGMGQVVLCSLVCAGLYPAGRASFTLLRRLYS